MNIKKIKEVTDREGVIFLAYSGFISQTLISSMAEALEQDAASVDMNATLSTNVLTTFIELAQNIMNYSKVIDPLSDEAKPEGIIAVGKDDGCYYVESQNIVSLVDKQKIEPKLQEIQKMTLEEIKTRYRELRRSGRNTHEKGGGIGFYEVAKRARTISYDFEEINRDKFYFNVRVVVLDKKSGE